MDVFDELRMFDQMDELLDQDFDSLTYPQLLAKARGQFLDEYLQINPEESEDDFEMRFKMKYDRKASNAVRAVACTASSRRQRTTSMPASWLAQDPILNKELLASTSIPYNRIDLSPIRPRVNSARISAPLPIRSRFCDARSDDNIFRAIAGSTPISSTIQRGYNAQPRSSHGRPEAFKFVPVEEENDDQINSISREIASGDINPTSASRQSESEEEIQHEYTRLLPSGRKHQSSGPRNYGSSGVSEVSSNGCGESNGSPNTTQDDSSQTSDEGSEGNRSNIKFTKQQWVILLILMCATLTSSFAVCLFPPFYPRLAEEKGASAAIYGFVIGTNCLTSFLVTPVIGKNLNKFGVLFSMVSGTFIGGLCCAISGFLEFYPPGWCFVVTSSLIRVLHATGNALVITATFTYAAMEYNNAVGKIFSFTRTAMNLGQLLGPLVGGALYQVGGFYLPFVTMGGLQATMGLVSLVILKEIPAITNESRGSNRQKFEKEITITNILRIPTIWFSFVTFIVATICNGFLSINLEPKVLRGFHLSPFWVGLLFGIKDGANSFSSPIWGYLCDKSRSTSVKPYLILSAILVAISFILMGAGSVFGMDMELSLSMLIFILCLNGIGIGGEQVVGVVDALHEATNAGYPDDPAMHGIVAGLWSSLSGAGRFISRVGSGILVDYVGFDPTAAIMTSLQGAVASLTLVYMIFCECSLKKQMSVKLNEVTHIRRSRDNQLVFTETNSPSESLMGKTVSIDIPRKSQRPSYLAARSLSYYRRRNAPPQPAQPDGFARSLAPEHLRA